MNSLKPLVVVLSVFLITMSCVSVYKDPYKKSIEYSNDGGTGKGVVEGKVVYEETGEPGAFANVLIKEISEGRVVSGTTVDFDGYFRIYNIEPGFYDLQIKNINFNTLTIDSIEVKANNTLKFTKDLVIREYQAQLEKPIIYIYPEDSIDVEVEVILEGELKHTYPKSEGTWNVHAHPDGTLIDSAGREYYGLFWEGESYQDLVPKSGSVVSHDSLIPFLEGSLEQLGLNFKESNEFMVYWLPILEKSEYNLIYFAAEDYTDKAQLIITPEPDNIIRVMMCYVPLEAPVDFPIQVLPEQPKREGFTVVEWGGTQCRLPNP